MNNVFILGIIGTILLLGFVIYMVINLKKERDLNNEMNQMWKIHVNRPKK